MAWLFKLMEDAPPADARAVRMQSPGATWEESWPEAEQALKEAAKQHAAMLSREREAKLLAQQRARAAEKALRALRLQKC